MPKFKKVRQVVNINLTLEGLKDRESVFCSELVSIYGEKNFKIQQKRYLSTLQKFKKLYPKAQDVCIARAPGRLIISGEHLDYHHGPLINTALMQDIIVVAAVGSKDSQINLNNMMPDFRPAFIDSVENIKVVPKPKKDLLWSEYCFAVINTLAVLIKKRNLIIPGLDIMIDGRPEYGGIPLGVGLSSSGGLEVALILAISGLLGTRENISCAEICGLCVDTESSLGFICGIQDPCGSLMGGKQIKDKSTWCQLIDCEPKKDNHNQPKLDTELIKIPDGYAILILRVGTMQRTVGQRNRHNIRVFEGELGAFILFGLLKDYINKHYKEQKNIIERLKPLFWKACYFSYNKLQQAGLSIKEEELTSLIKQLPNNMTRNKIIADYSYLGVTDELFDQFVQSCQIMEQDITTLKFNLRGNILFVINEAKRAELSALALKSQNMSKFFKLQHETHEELSKYYGITNPPAKKIVKELKKLNLVLSARMLGPGSGANVVVWTKVEDEERLKQEVYRIFYDISPDFEAMSATEKDKQIICVNSGQGANLLFQGLATSKITTYSDLRDLSARIEIKPDRGYEVLLTRDIFNIQNKILLKQIAKRDVLVIWDNGIPADTKDKFEKYLTYHKVDFNIWVMSGGEKIKTVENFLNLCERAIREGVERFTLMIIVGGGAVLDTAGFAASVIHRAIPHIRIPSTLLAQADAGVGAKNAVNFAGYKNAIGVFNPAEAIILDPQLILTIDKRQIRSGLAECIKVAIIRDWPLFNLIEKHYNDVLTLDISQKSHAVDIIWRTVQAHLRQIATDPFEDKTKRPLTFAHAWGHWLEIISEYRLIHGEAVAIGIAIDSRIALKRGLISQKVFDRILILLIKSGLPIYDQCCDDQEKVWQGLEKYRQHQGGITIPLPKGEGEIAYAYEFLFTELKESLDYLRSIS